MKKRAGLCSSVIKSRRGSEKVELWGQPAERVGGIRKRGRGQKKGEVLELKVGGANVSPQVLARASSEDG